MTAHLVNQRRMAIALTLTLVFSLDFNSNATSAKQVVGSVEILSTPEQGKPIIARTDSRGTIHLIFEASGELRYVKSSDAGRSYEKSIQLIDSKLHHPGLQFQVWDMAIGKNDSVHVALGTNAWKLKLPQNEWAYYYAKLAPGAKAFTPLINLNKKSSEGFSIAADGKGKVTACWLSGKLFANVSHDDGNTFAPAIEVDHSCDPCDCCTTSAAYGLDGKLAILYREETNNERDMYLISWDQDQTTIARTKISKAPWKIASCPMTYYSVNPTDNGFVAAWPTKGTVYWSKLDFQGKVQPPGEVHTKGRSGMRTGILAMTSSNGDVLVSWMIDGMLCWQVYTKDGKLTNDAGVIECSGKSIAAVASQDGKFILFR